MGFNLRQKLEETFADINPFDNGATAQTVRANRTKVAPAQTVKTQTQSRPMVQQNKPTFQNQSLYQSQTQVPTLNFNSSMPKAQVFGSSNDPLKMGQVKSPQLAPAQPAKPVQYTAPTAQVSPNQPQVAKQLQMNAGKSQVSGISDATWAKMNAQTRQNLLNTENKAKQARGDVWNIGKVADDVKQGVVKPIISGLQQSAGNVGDVALMGGNMLSDTAAAMQGKSQTERDAINRRFEGYRDKLKGLKTVTGDSLNARPDFQWTGDTNRDISNLAGRSLQVGLDATTFVNPTRQIATGATTNLAGKQALKQLAGFSARDATFFGVGQGLTTGAETYGQTGDINQALTTGAQAGLLSAAGQGAMDIGGFTLGATARGIGKQAQASTPHAQLMRTDPTYKANTDKLTAVDATIARAQANGDIRALEGLQAVKAQLSDSNALIARRYAEQGFLGGKNATGFKDAEARGEVFTDTPDGLPRFEVSDENMKIKNPNGQTLGELIDHPELFKNYPQLKNVKTQKSTGIANGFYDEKTNTLTYDPNLSPDKILDTLVHEPQHAIQDIEGFARGGSPADFVYKRTPLEDSELYDLFNKEAAGSLTIAEKLRFAELKEKSSLDKAFEQYHKLAGEAEAEAAAKRRTMPMSERYVPDQPVKKQLQVASSEKAQPTGKYKKTLNVLDKDDEAYLRRIFTDEQVDNFKAGDFSHWRGGGKEYFEDIAHMNITSETPKTQAQKLEGRIAEYKLGSNKVYHATDSSNTSSILSGGFKKGSKLPKNAYRGGGYGHSQDSISFATTPVGTDRFATGSRGVMFESELKPNAKVVEINGITDATELDEFIPELKKQGIDAVHIGGGESEIVVINPKAVKRPTNYREFDTFGGKAKEQLKGFGTIPKQNLRSTFYDSLDVPKKDLIVRNSTDQANYITKAHTPQPKPVAQGKVEVPKQPTPFEQDLKKAGLGTEPDAYRKQPKDVKKAIDAYIANENPQLAYALDSKLHFPDGIPKVRPEDVKRITGLTPREAGIPPIYVSKSASPMDKLAVEYETTVRGNVDGELKMTSEDFLDTMMDAIEANRSVGQQTKLIRELRNNPDVIAKAKATLEAERAQYGAPEVVEPSKSDVAFLKRTEKQRVEQEVTEHKAKMKAINKKIGEEKSRNPVLPTYKTKQVGIIDKAFRSTRSIIERQGESGKKLADALQEQRTVKELWIRQIETQIPTVMKLKGKEFENFIDATQGNAKPLNESVSKAVTEWRSAHPEVRQRGLDAGLNIGDLGETYYPHFIDYDKIYKDKNTYNEAINHLVTTKQAATPEKAIELLSRARDISRNREFGNLEASRIIDLPFYDRSKNTLASYINSSADRITKAEVFGKSDEKALGLIKQIGLEGGDTEAAKNAFDVAAGAKQYNHTASKVSGGIRQYVTTTRLGLGALTNISQNVNTGVVTGHLRTMGAIFKQLDPKTRQWAADTGVISDAIIQDLRRGYGAETFGNKKLGRVVNAVTAPGFATVEKFNRRVAATAGKDYALRLAQKGDAKSISTLRKLGVEGDINGTLTDAQQVQAARKIVEKTQFKVDAQDLPGWTDSPGGKLVSQFRTFSYSQAKFFSNEVLKPAAKGNLMPLTRVLAALPLGYALYETRRMIDGRPEEEDKSKVALSSFQKIGGAGLALDIYLGMNPVGGKYLPSDRRVSMAVGTLGGPSAGIAADAVGSISEAVQRKNTPEDTSRLDGKIAVANNGESYTDLTALSRFGLRQLPIAGTPIVNRAIPYKKQSDADAGKSTTGNAGLDELAAAKEKRSADLKASFSKEDWKLYNLSKADRQKLVSNGTYTQAKIDGLMKSGGAKESELGYGTTTTSVSAKTPTSAKSILETYDTLDTEARTKWSTEKNTDTAVTKGLQSWLGDKVKIPEVTNDVAKEWADFQNDYADGKISKLKENDQKKAILKKAFNSQLNTDEKEIYNLSKAELQYYYDNGDITDENINKAIAVEKQLFEAGLIAKETLQRNLGSSARGYKGSTAKKSGSKFDYKLNGFGTPSASNSKQLHDLLKKATMRVST